MIYLASFECLLALLEVVPVGSYNSSDKHLKELYEAESDKGYLECLNSSLYVLYLKVFKYLYNTSTCFPPPLGTALLV